MKVKTHDDAAARPAADLPASTRVICGIDASRADPTAVRGACALAGPRGHVALVCVAYHTGAGHNAQATITEARATAALERGMWQAREAGAAASVYLIRSPDASGALLRAAADGDLLVVGSHGGSRAGGIMLGGVATTALHRATVPVLVARPWPEDREPPILVASDGRSGSDDACALAAGVAVRTSAPVTLFTAGEDRDDEARHALARQTVELAEATGSEPTVVTGRGRPADAIVEAAAASGCSLIVVGSSGRTGVRALGSVSERVAHRARCSVLVARPKGV